ncbi:MAG: hypothetical protein JMN24_10635 [gamma proteobacterium endosymbiont of Lamellibrachia anaximandri]|nr:hypothetical protein [gamma proteobacterium endosymbiont of Lamellibrachia anaximandri]MBL3617494.1 hypothetical protein [gamma proteobacterium endosymbiont of Lamellibrachia anaximandri]
MKKFHFFEHSCSSGGITGGAQIDAFSWQSAPDHGLELVLNQAFMWISREMASGLCAERKETDFIHSWCLPRRKIAAVATLQQASYHDAGAAKG